MTYTIIRTYPVYCQITDGLIGSRSVQTGLVYETKAFALAKAGMLNGEEYRCGGDDRFNAVDTSTGLRAYDDISLRQRVESWNETFDEMPF